MSTTTRTAPFPLALAWGVLALAILQTAAPVASGLFGGSSPDGATVDLLISPAGCTFSIWGLIYLLSIVTAVAVLLTRATATSAPRRLLVDLAVTFAGAAVWIGLSAMQWSWFTSVTLTVMTIALLDAVRVAAASTDGREPRWLGWLVRGTVGTYAAWATAAVFQNWASDLGQDVADPATVSWQLALLVASGVLGVAVTARFGDRLPLYPLTLLWAFTGILVTAWGETTSVVVTVLVAMAAVVVALVLRVRPRGRARRARLAPERSADGTDVRPGAQREL